MGMPLVRAKVGDRYVLEQLLERGWQLGGENSGHLICLDKHTTGDAIIAALAVLRALIEQRTTLAEAAAPVTLFPQRLINVPVQRGWDWRASAAVTSAERVATSALGNARARAAASVRDRAGVARDGRGARAGARGPACRNAGACDRGRRRAVAVAISASGRLPASTPPIPDAAA